MTSPDYSTTRRLTSEKPACFDTPVDGMQTLLKTPDSEQKVAEGGLRLQGLYKTSSEDKPLITVVTVVYNGAEFLEETIKSIIEQTYDNVEYIIVDGGSTDGTLEIIKKYDHAIDYWASEPDKGISDAFNKALTLCSGNYINFQGDGDGFSDRNALFDLFSVIGNENNKFILARINRIARTGEIIYSSRYVKSFNKKSLIFKMSMPHQALFTHRSYFGKYGFFPTDNKYCMDYEHVLLSYNSFPNVKTVDLIVANWRADGIGNNKTLEVLNEYHRIREKHKIAPLLCLKFSHRLSILKFLVKKVIKRA